MCFQFLPGLLRSRWLAPVVMVVLTASILFTAWIMPGRPDHAATPLPTSKFQAIKLLTREEGIYRISSLELSEAGLVPTDPSHLSLSTRGESRPFWVEMGMNGYVLFFYAPKPDSRYTPFNVYWLAASSPAVPPGLGMSAQDEVGSLIEITAPANSSESTLRIEQNNHYQPQVIDHDHWFWQSLPAPTSMRIEFDLSHPETSTSLPAWLRVHVWGSTEASQSPDHHLVIMVNGQAAADVLWEGRGAQTFEIELPAGSLNNRANTISLQLPGDTGAPADIVLLDWIEVSYERELIFENGRLEFISRGEVHQMSGFRGQVGVFDITKPDHPVRIVDFLLEGEDRLEFAGKPGNRYLAVDETGYRSPEQLLNPAMEPDLRAEDKGAEYLIIGPASLLEAVQPLLDWRSAGGLVSQAVPFEQIYDQFNHGMPEPQAIRSFLQYAGANWPAAPRYILLVGDASYDPYGFQASPLPVQLPAFFVQTEYGGETASDVPFALLDGDGYPDLAVGRLPAQTAAEVEAVAAKILAYEQGPGPQKWQRRLLAVADGQEKMFQTDAEYFLSLFPSEYEPTLIVSTPGAGDTHRQIQSKIQEGALLVAYFGHGSMQMWGKDRLFLVDDVSGLENRGTLPVVVQMTCLAGLFTHPTTLSLAEAFLMQAEAGAVAVIAPTSLTLAVDQSAFFRPFAAAWAASSGARLGDIFLAAQRQMPIDSPGAQDVLETFLLIGDPALQLPGNQAP